VLETGVATGAEFANLTLLSAKLNYNKGATDAAANALAATRAERAVQLNPKRRRGFLHPRAGPEPAKRPAEAVACLQKAQALWAAAGKPSTRPSATRCSPSPTMPSFPVAREIAFPA
jgi:hypothetical protein